MNLKHLSAAAALAVVAALGASPAYAQLAEGVAAVVNDNVISTFDVRQRATLLLVSAGIQATPDLQQRARAQALRDLVDERLQIQETAKFDIHISEDEINRRLGDIARSNHTTLDSLQQTLGQAGVSIGTLRSQIEADAAWNRLITGMYGSRVRVSEVEIRETQERIAANATRPQYLISEIFLPASTEQEFTDMQQGAMHLLEQMQHGAPFPSVARQFSRSSSASQGGDIGWIAATELSPELQPIAERLQQGQVSLPIRTPTGVYLIAMRDRRAGVPVGSSVQISLRQISAPLARQSALERFARRVRSCDGLDDDVRGIDGAVMTDLGATSEADLSPAIRDRITGVSTGRAATVA
ncbi:MAG: peptidylprolyl isomerase, partial [Casimicrobiaceae bacterium]